MSIVKSLTCTSQMIKLHHWSALLETKYTNFVGKTRWLKKISSSSHIPSLSLSLSQSLNKPMINSVMFNQWLNSQRLLFLHSPSQEWINSVNLFYCLPDTLICLPDTTCFPIYSFVFMNILWHYTVVLFCSFTSSPHPFCSHRLRMLSPIFPHPPLSLCGCGKMQYWLVIKKQSPVVMTTWRWRDRKRH